MSLWPELKKLQQGTWVDLTHPLTNDSPYWAGIPEGSVELCKTVFDYDEEMLSCRIHTYKFPGQFGTHVDFPSHFTPGKVGSEAYGVEQMAMPLCVIDLTGKVAAEVGYPVIVKAAAGGGGRGMRVAWRPGDMADAMSAARIAVKPPMQATTSCASGVMANSGVQRATR